MSTKLIQTEAVYTKNQAERAMRELREQHGGTWFIEQSAPGKKWYVYQATTREQDRRIKERENAEATLRPEFDWFSPTAISSIYRERDRVQKKLDEWREHFALNPMDALSWGTETCQHAADFWVISSIISYIEAGRDPEKICQMFEDEAARSARYEALLISSSPMHNLMEAAKRIAMVKYTRKMRSHLEHLADAIATLYDL